jgi:glyoxylase-like metal-dependent hydrolase (beta-lactamase superfamily II)
LLNNVMRLTAPNPGFMTGPGTNSYLVGDPRTGYLVIDPGPADPEHLHKLWHAAGGDIRMIVCTHSHADHSPGAKPLQALCAVAPPILGLPSQPTARANSEFTPDRALQHKELLSLSAPDLPAEQAHHLMVIHTPGHAANHLCLVLLEDGLLFSGDHILNGSTTVIDPPDGDMSAYLDSLDTLSQACDSLKIDFILPAHGYVTETRGQNLACDAGAPPRHTGRLGRESLRRCARAPVAGGQTFAAGACGAPSVGPSLAARSRLTVTIHPQ